MYLCIVCLSGQSTIIIFVACCLVLAICSSIPYCPYSSFGLQQQQPPFTKRSTMVFYECVVTAKNTTHFYALTNLMKKISHEVVNSGGIVRAIHNHGIRDLPHRFKARFPDKEGNRYYRKGRFISIYYDSNPATMQQVDQILTMDEEILRNSHLKARSILDYVNIAREDRNPLMRKVRGMQRQETAQSLASKR